MTIPVRPVVRGTLLAPSRTEEYALELYTEVASDSADLATKYEMVENFPASAKRIKKLSWTYERPGGCGELVCELAVPYDKYGLAYASRSLKHFQHVVLYVRGVRWWCGTVESVAPKLALPETVTLTARGYFRQAEKATISWNFARHQLKTAGDVGELPGLVRSLWKLMPLLFGTETGKPNPLADTCYLVGSTARARGIVLDNVTVKDAIDEAATLAGNYEWGVDEWRQLYFVPPQTLTTTTAMYTADPARNTWGVTPTAVVYGTYGDETYWNPNPLPFDADGEPLAPIEEQGIFVVGGNTISVDAKDSVQGSKNVLKVVAAPKRPGDPPQLFTVVDAEWLDYWKRRMTAKTATSFFSEEADVRRGERRLQLLGPPQTEGSIRGITFARRPLHPTGAVRLVDPEYGTNAYYRIQRVSYAFEQDDHLTVNVELAFQVPPDQYFAEQLRRDATISQNALIGERVPFIVYERFTPYTFRFDSAVLGMTLAGGIIVPSIAHARLVETASGRVLVAYRVHNNILNAGRRDAMMILIGARPPGAYKWVGIGTSSRPVDARQGGIITAITTASGDFRAAGAWSIGASDFTLDVTIAGTTVEGDIREVALYPQQTGGVALYRYVLPAKLSLTSANTFVLALEIVP